jgi:hypothetical protein
MKILEEMWMEGFEHPNHTITGSGSSMYQLFLIGPGHSSRLSFDVSGAVSVQNSDNVIETVDSLDIFTPIDGSG